MDMNYKEKQERILDAAFRIFVERKIEPVSMGEIAEAAGIGRATLFQILSEQAGAGHCSLYERMEEVYG